LGCCAIGARRRKKDLGYLGWIEKRGVVAGRTELEAVERVELDGTGIEMMDGKESVKISTKKRTSSNVGRRKEEGKKEGG
jgi:hypothetical protein